MIWREATDDAVRVMALGTRIRPHRLRRTFIALGATDRSS